MNVLTLGVAGNTLLRGAADLSLNAAAAVGPAWAAGLLRRRLARLELARMLALAAATAVYGVPLGLVVVWMLVVEINVETFG